MICPLSGDKLGVAHDKNYAFVEWRGRGRIVFSYAQKGKAMTAHFASDKRSLRWLKVAIDEFCRWIFALYDCRMIFAMISRESVVRLVKKCGFVHLLDCDEGSVYVRSR